jgi:hypothetical protein
MKYLAAQLNLQTTGIAVSPRSIAIASENDDF